MRPFPRSLTPVIVVGLVGLALVGWGAVWFATAGPTSFGWMSYAPAPETFAIQGAVLIDQRRCLAMAVAVVGAILVSASAGYALGRRRQRD